MSVARDEAEPNRDRYVDLDGDEIDLKAWIALLPVDQVSRTIAQDTLPDGRILRTIWTGTDFPMLGIRPWGTAILNAAGDIVIVEIGQYSARDIALRCHAIHLGQISRDLTQGPQEA